MKINKSEAKVLRMIRDKLPVQKTKAGKYPANIKKATVSLLYKKLIHLCDDNHWCISDLELTDSLLKTEQETKFDFVKESRLAGCGHPTGVPVSSPDGIEYYACGVCGARLDD